MLYLSTRNKADSFTAYRVLHTPSVPGDGLFMPMRLPVQNDVSLAAFERMGFGEAAATILNVFFGTQITGWDVDFTVGRQALDLMSLGHKICIAESWHNPAGTHAYLTERLYALACGEKYCGKTPNQWFTVVVNIAILFGVYGKFCRRGVYEFDVAVASGDLLMLLAMRYAQKMGLPIRKIILGCEEDDGLWDFLSYGDYTTSKMDRAAGMEALLWLEFSYGEVSKYLEAARRKGIYRLNTCSLDRFRKGLFGTVVGDYRVLNAMGSTEKANQYKMEFTAARAFCALQDYRAKTGENKITLLFAHGIPAK